MNQNKATIFLLILILFFTISISAQDLSDGVYKGTGEGMHGEMVIQIEIETGEITELEVLEHSETPTIAETAIEKVKEKILENQNWDVDTVAGATYTSDGIKEGVKEALAKATSN